MAAVIAFHALAAGRDDFRPADGETAAVGVTPVAVDRIGKGGSREQQQNRCRGECLQSNSKHELRSHAFFKHQSTFASSRYMTLWRVSRTQASMSSIVMWFFMSKRPQFMICGSVFFQRL